MKASQLPLFTVKENPHDAQVISHRLLVRAGYIRRQAAGMFILLPFALKVQQRIEAIIREEMIKAKAVEVQLPVLTLAELWQQSGRWYSMGKEMMRVKDRHQTDFALGPTHEESMVSLANSFMQSYKQLPLNLFQIGTKYRDEIRPRYGLVRGREFLMKDGYSFHMNEDSLDEGYLAMKKAYQNVFSRCGLKTILVEADSGAIGGSASEEFMVVSEIGEEVLLLAQGKDFDYKANQEKTEFIPAQPFPQLQECPPAQEVETIDLKTMEQVSAFLKKSPEYFIKTVVMENQDHLVFAFVPGNRDLNEAKLRSVSGLADLEMAIDDHVYLAVAAQVGYLGPANLKVVHEQEVEIITHEKKSLSKKILLYFDIHLKGRAGLVAGANKKDYHIVNLQEGRDFFIDETFDLVMAQAGDLCPLDKNTPLTASKGLEVGHIFKLGDKYSKAMNFSVIDESGKNIFPLMGTYGIGVGRIMATVVEQSHDDKGIIWPVDLSPFLIYLVSLAKTPEQKEKAEQVYQALWQEDIAAYLDDRNERAGVKFHDAELVGFPWQAVIGKTFFNEQRVELKNRKTQEQKNISIAELIEQLKHNGETK